MRRRCERRRNRLRWLAFCQGSPAEKELRNAVENRGVPGPRILTSLEPLADEKKTPAELREIVRQRKGDVTALSRIVFVMRRGVVYRQSSAGSR